MLRTHRRLLVSLALATSLLAACEGDSFAGGIGRPPSTIGQNPQRSSVEIVEVAPLQFVELLNTGEAPLDLTGFTLVSPNLGATPSVAATGELAPASRLAVDTPTLEVTPAGPSSTETYGEVALVDADGVTHAYFAWGRDPAASGSSLFVSAFKTGAVLGGNDFVAVPPTQDFTGLSFVSEADVQGCTTPTRATPIDPGAALLCQETAE